MDFYKAVTALEQELRKVDQAIATLERLLSEEAQRPLRRRGRTSMPDEERKLVSARMKRYWEQRRSSVASAG